MVDAYFDNGRVSDAVVVRKILEELGATCSDFGLIPLYAGEGKQGIGRECRQCGAPLGSIDPDECRWIMLGTCSDCSERNV